MLSNPMPTTVREYSMKVRLELEIIQSMQTPMDIRFGSLDYFSYLCIVKEIQYIYESNK